MTHDPLREIADRIRRLVAQVLGTPPRPELRPVPVVARPGRAQRPNRRV